MLLVVSLIGGEATLSVDIDEDIDVASVLLPSQRDLVINGDEPLSPRLVRVGPSLNVEVLHLNVIRRSFCFEQYQVVPRLTFEIPYRNGMYPSSSRRLHLMVLLLWVWGRRTSILIWCWMLVMIRHCLWANI